MAKFMVTFHLPARKLPYSLVRLKHLLRAYIDAVNGQNNISPEDMHEFEVQCQKLTSSESANPLIRYERRNLKQSDGSEKVHLWIMLVGEDEMPFAIISEEN